MLLLFFINHGFGSRQTINVDGILQQNISELTGIFASILLFIEGLTSQGIIKLPSKSSTSSSKNQLVLSVIESNFDILKTIPDITPSKIPIMVRYISKVCSNTVYISCVKKDDIKNTIIELSANLIFPNSLLKNSQFSSMIQKYVESPDRLNDELLIIINPSDIQKYHTTDNNVSIYLFVSNDLVWLIGINNSNNNNNLLLLGNNRKMIESVRNLSKFNKFV